MIPRQNFERNGLEKEVLIETKVTLEGTLYVPENATGIVLFAHGSGSSRHSTRNRYVAEVLQSEGIAALLFDLLTYDEGLLDARTGQLRLDIPFLTNRLIEATHWVRRTELRTCP